MAYPYGDSGLNPIYSYPDLPPSPPHLQDDQNETTPQQYESGMDLIAAYFDGPTEYNEQDNNTITGTGMNDNNVSTTAWSSHNPLMGDAGASSSTGNGNMVEQGEPSNSLQNNFGTAPQGAEPQPQQMGVLLPNAPMPYPGGVQRMALFLEFYTYSQDPSQFPCLDHWGLKLVLRKQLRNSDVSNIGRIILPKRECESFFPYLQQKDGLSLIIMDLFSNDYWKMRFRFWPNNKSRMYVLENTGEFITSRGIGAGDHIGFYRSHGPQYYLCCKLSRPHPVHPPPNGIQGTGNPAAPVGGSGQQQWVAGGGEGSSSGANYNINGEGSSSGANYNINNGEGSSSGANYNINGEGSSSGANYNIHGEGSSSGANYNIHGEGFAVPNNAEYNGANYSMSGGGVPVGNNAGNNGAYDMHGEGFAVPDNAVYNGGNYNLTVANNAEGNPPLTNPSTTYNNGQYAYMQQGQEQQHASSFSGYWNPFQF